MKRFLFASALLLSALLPTRAARACQPQACAPTTLLTPKVPANTKGIKVRHTGATQESIELRGGDGRSIPATGGFGFVTIDGPLVAGETLTLTIQERCAGYSTSDDAGVDAPSSPATKLAIEVGPAAPTPLAPTASFGSLRSVKLADELPACIGNGSTGGVSGEGVAVDVNITPSESLKEWGALVSYVLIVDGASYSLPAGVPPSTPPHVKQTIVASCGETTADGNGWFLKPGEHKVEVVASVRGFGDQKASVGTINLRCGADADAEGAGCSTSAPPRANDVGLGVFALTAVWVARRLRKHR